VADANGHLVGMLTETDLIGRWFPRPRARWWQFDFCDSERLADDYRKAVGITVGDVMTRQTVAVGPEDSTETAAVLMHQRALSVLPVVALGHVVGILTRGDLIDGLAWPVDAPDSAAPDAELVRVMQERMDEAAWTSKHRVHVQADRGVLSLCGLVDSQAERAALLAMARTIAGCTAVEDHLLVRRELRGRRV
jgi:CBS-domain-containing membrane protein